MPSPSVLNGFVTPVQVFPSVDIAILDPPVPTATQYEPFHATPFPELVKIVLPRPVHVVPPSLDVAIVFPPEPTATHKPRLAFIVLVAKLPDTFNPPVNVVAPPTRSVPLIVVLERVDAPVTFNNPPSVVPPLTVSCPPVTFNPPDNVVEDVTIRVPKAVLTAILPISPINVL